MSVAVSRSVLSAPTTASGGTLPGGGPSDATGARIASRESIALRPDARSERDEAAATPERESNAVGPDTHGVAIEGEGRAGEHVSDGGAAGSPEGELVQLLAEEHESLAYRERLGRYLGYHVGRNAQWRAYFKACERLAARDCTHGATAHETSARSDRRLA